MNNILTDLEAARIADAIKERNKKLDYIYSIVNRVETLLSRLNGLADLDIDSEYISLDFQLNLSNMICKMSGSLRSLYTLTGNSPSIYRCQLIKDLQDRIGNLVYYPEGKNYLVIDKNQLDIFKPNLQEFTAEVKEKMYKIEGITQLWVDAYLRKPTFVIIVKLES